MKYHIFGNKSPNNVRLIITTFIVIVIKNCIGADIRLIHSILAATTLHLDIMKETVPILIRMAFESIQGNTIIKD